MSVSLTTALIGTAPRQSDAPHVWLSGDALLREIRSAMRAVPHVRRECFTSRGLTPAGEALLQSVAVSVLQSTDAPHGSPRAVLAYIDRCERMPSWSARNLSGAAVPRASVGRHLLEAKVRSVHAQSAGWRDTLDTYRTRAQSDRGEHGYITDGAVPVSRDSAAPVSVMDAQLAALAVQRRAREQRSGRVASLDLPALAGVVAEHLDFTPGTVTHRRVTAALVQAAASAAGDVVDALSALAGERGCTLNAVRVDATRGSAIVREVRPAKVCAAVSAAIREMRDSEAVWDRVDLPSALADSAKSRTAAAALEAVSVLLREGGAWEPDSIRTGRSMLAWPDRTPAIDAAPFPGLRRPVKV